MGNTEINFRLLGTLDDQAPNLRDIDGEEARNPYRASDNPLGWLMRTSDHAIKGGSEDITGKLGTRPLIEDDAGEMNIGRSAVAMQPIGMGAMYLKLTLANQSTSRGERASAGKESRFPSISIAENALGDKLVLIKRPILIDGGAQERQTDTIPQAVGFMPRGLSVIVYGRLTLKERVKASPPQYVEPLLVCAS
ncbi:MAG: hypothetical protein AAGI34_05970 [Pseudomonadota bacterium]